MKKSILIFLVAALVGCHPKPSKQDLANINGYWEIEQVVLADGQKKAYKINETIDYFELKDGKGFRKKVMPQFDGRYLVNDLKENLTVLEKNGDFFLQYDTPYGKWKEQLLEVSTSELILKNDSQVEYHYKKPQLFSLK